MLLSVWAACVLASAGIAVAAPLRAGQPGVGKAASVRMQVEAGFDGNFRPAAWLPIRVRVTNQGPNFTGTLSVQDSGKQSANNVQPANLISYRRTIVMPQGGVKDFTLYVPGADLGTSISVTMVAGPLGFAQQQVQISSLSNSTLLVGVLSGGPATVTQLKSVAALIGGVQVITTHLDARRLDPQVLALANLDAIVLGNYASASLSAAQDVALEDWVRAGGTLITLGGPTAQATVGGLPAALRLMRPGEPLTLSRIPGLDRLGGPLPPGQSVVASGPVLAGTVVLGSAGAAALGGDPRAAGAPLIVERSLGEGTVIFCTLDPTLAPAASWAGLPHLWSFLTAEARPGAATATTALAGTQQVSSRNDTLDNEIDNVSPPSTTLFVVLLGVYVLLLVPLNFVVLGRLRKPDWSWVTLPALALVLVAATYGSAYFGRGRNVRASVVSVLYLTSGSDRVMTQSAVGLFSPLAGDYTIKQDSPDQLATALFSTSTNGGTLGLSASQDLGEVTMPGMAMWSSRNATFSGIGSAPSGLEGRLAVGANGHLVGTLWNRSLVPWHGLVVVPYAGQPQAYGDLAPGAKVQVDIATGNVATGSQALGDFYGQSAALLPSGTGTGPLLARMAVQPAGLLVQTVRFLAAAQGIPTSPGESVGMRFQHIADQVFGSASPAMYGQAMVLGWTTDPLTGFSANGDRPVRSDTNLLVQALPVTLGPGAFVINANSLPTRLAGSDLDLQGGFQAQGLSISTNSSALFVAHVPPAPAGRRLSLRSLTLSVNSGGAGGALSSQTAALYDWATGTWVGVDVTSGQVDVRRPARFVNAAGTVRVRLSALDSTLGISDANTGVLIGATGTVR